MADELRPEERHAFARDVLTGLSDRPRWLPCRYLYDEQGSRLFELITGTPEYYLTRTEATILAASAAEIRDLTGAVTIVELGSGSSIKTGYLLAAYTGGTRPMRYLPVDVSESALAAGAAQLRAAHPTVQVTEIRGSYDEAFPLLRGLSPVMLVFLGSTIGNLNQTEAAQFWKDVSDQVTAGDFVLLGIDLVKDSSVIDAAYNDASGHSAEFTRNIFRRMNRELGAGLDLDGIEHVASYNPEWQRVEIFARFTTDQAVRLEPLGTSIRVSAGERIMTEISRKFVLDEFSTYVSAFGFKLRRVFTDERQWFAVVVMEKTTDQPGSINAT